MSQHFENPKELGIDADPVSIKITLLENSDRLIDYVTFSPIMGGHISTFKTSDPVNAPLPNRDLLMLQFLLIRAFRMAGREGQDMLETCDSDDNISFLATNNSVLPKHEVEYYLRNRSATASINSPEPSPLGILSTPDQPPPKNRSITRKVSSYLRQIFNTHATRYDPK